MKRQRTKERNEESIEKRIQDNHKVKLTGYTFRKINAYAREVSRMIGHPSEVVGFLTGEIDDTSCTATDACLVCEQHVEDWKAFPEGNAFTKTFASVKKSNRKIVGMWHSHGSIDNFHSKDDDKYLSDVLIDSTYYLENIIEENGLKTHYASSVVINQNSYLRQDPSESPEKDTHYFCCVGVRDEQDKKVIVEDLELELVEDKVKNKVKKRRKKKRKKKRKDEIDLQEICQDIGASVMYQGRFLECTGVEDITGQAGKGTSERDSYGIWRRIINYFSGKGRGKIDEQQA